MCAGHGANLTSESLDESVSANRRNPQGGYREVIAEGSGVFKINVLTNRNLIIRLLGGLGCK